MRKVLGSTAFFRHGHTKLIGLHMRKVLGSTAFFRHGHTKLIGLHMKKQTALIGNQRRGNGFALDHASFSQDISWLISHRANSAKLAYKSLS